MSRGRHPPVLPGATRLWSPVEGITRIEVGLAGGGSLSVAVPGHASTSEIRRLGDQLRALADVLELARGEGVG